MALRLADDFAGYFDLDDLASGMWTDRSSTGISLNPTGSGRGGPCLVLNEYGAYLERLFNNQTEWTIGFRFLFEGSLPDLNDWFLQLRDNSGTPVTQVSLMTNVNGPILFYRSTSSILGTSAKSLAPDTEYHLELKAIINDSTGSLELRINNEVWLTYAGDTRFSGDLGVSRIRLTHQAGATTGPASPLRVWDFYALDGQAGAKGFQSMASRVDTLYVSGAGSSAQFTPTGAATNHEAADDAPVHNFDTDFNVSSTVGQKDLFAMGNLPISNVGTVTGLIVVNSARSDDGGARGVKGKVKSGATEGTSANAAITDAYKKYPYVVETNPDTGVAFTKTEVNSMEAGYELGS